MIHNFKAAKIESGAYTPNLLSTFTYLFEHYTTLSMRLLALFLILFSSALSAESRMPFIKPKQVTTPANEFVRITSSGFVLQNKPFYPLVLNYMATVMYDDNVMFPCVHPAYQKGNRYRYAKPDLCYRELVNQFILIRDMGFNTVRIVDIGEAHVTGNQRHPIGFKGIRLNADQQMYFLNTKEDYARYFSAINKLMKALNEAGLKCIFAVRLINEVRATEKHFRKFAEEFRNEPAILAYDYFNEPLYFDKILRSKEEVYYITKRWQKARKKYAPKQLSTIGLASRSEMFEWDPAMVQCDFVSFHPYNKEPMQALNEMYWYNQHLKKPWIIGETGLASDNDSVPYQKQVEYAEEVLKQTVNCGGKGFSWWHYSETDWNTSFENYLGIVTKKGTTINSKGATVTGTLKPVTDVFKQFTATKYKGNCECPPNYYNLTSQTKFRIIGRIVDSNGNPIPSGGVIGWDKDWIHSFYSPVKPDGSFSLYSNFQFYHWMVSALEYERIMLDCNFNNAIMMDGTPTLNLGTIQLEKVF